MSGSNPVAASSRLRDEGGLCRPQSGCAHPQLGCCAFYLFIRADPNLIGLRSAGTMPA